LPRRFGSCFGSERQWRFLVNIFAGINRCDWVAQGVVQAAAGLKVPLIVRLAGSPAEAGQQIVRDSGLPSSARAIWPMPAKKRSRPRAT